MKLRNPTKEELLKWKILGRANLFALLFIEQLWEYEIITTKQKQNIQSKIRKKWKEEHFEFNPFTQAVKE
jgi:hypothetical protein